MKIIFKDFIGSNFFYSFSHSPVAICSFLIAASLIFCAIIAPVIAPYSPYDPATLNLMNGFSARLKQMNLLVILLFLERMTKAATSFQQFCMGCVFRFLLDFLLFCLRWS